LFACDALGFVGLVCGLDFGILESITNLFESLIVRFEVFWNTILGIIHSNKVVIVTEYTMLIKRAATYIWLLAFGPSSVATALSL
jgi:hypothetical protein